MTFNKLFSFLITQSMFSHFRPRSCNPRTFSKNSRHQAGSARSRTRAVILRRRSSVSFCTWGRQPASFHNATSSAGPNLGLAD